MLAGTAGQGQERSSYRMSGGSPIESWLCLSFIVQAFCTAFVSRDDTGSSISTPPFQASVLNVKSGRMGATLLYCTFNIHHSTLHGVRVSQLWVQQGAGEMAQHFKTSASRGLKYGSQLPCQAAPVPPVPVTLAPSSGLPGHLYPCAYIHTQTYTE